MCEMTAACASQIKHEQLLNDVSFAVARKSLDAARSQGEALVDLLEAAAAPKAADRGQNFDSAA